MQQQTHNPNQTTAIRRKPLTPIEKLLKEKVDLEYKCRAQQEKLNTDFAYIQDNASSLLLSGLSSLLFPSRDKEKSTEKKNGKSSSSQTENNKNDSNKQTPISIADVLSLSKTLLPVAWEITQPILISWGIRKASSLFRGLLFKKKKTAF